MTPDYIALPDPEAAELITARVRQWDSDEHGRWATLGLMCSAVEKRLLYQHIMDPEDGFPCRSFARWLRVVAPGSYSACYAAKKDVEELSDVPAADLAQIPQSNLATMKQLSTKVRSDPKVIAAAKTKDFVEHIRKHHPNQHIETKRTMRFRLDESAAVKVDEVLLMATEQGASGPGEALEMIAQAARDQWEMLQQVENAVEGASK